MTVPSQSGRKTAFPEGEVHPEARVMEQGDGPSPTVRLWVPTSRESLPLSGKAAPAAPRSYEQWGQQGAHGGQLHGSQERGPGSGQLVGGLLATLLTHFYLFCHLLPLPDLPSCYFTYFNAVFHLLCLWI